MSSTATSPAVLSREEFVRVWRDTTQPMAWDSPVSEWFFSTARDVNSGRPRDEQIHTASDYQRFHDERGGRTPQYAAVVLDDVLARGKKAPLIAGSFHLVRVPDVPNVAARNDAAAPDAPFTVVHMEVGDRTVEVEEVLESGPCQVSPVSTPSQALTVPGRTRSTRISTSVRSYSSLTSAPVVAATYEDEE